MSNTPEFLPTIIFLAIGITVMALAIITVGPKNEK